MGKPSHTERQGPFTVKVWVRSEAGEVLTDGGFTVRCAEHNKVAR